TAGPFSCLNNTSRFTYLVPSFQSIDFLPLDCTVLSNSIPLPYRSNNMDFNETAKGTIAFGETMLRWTHCFLVERPAGRPRGPTRRLISINRRLGSHLKIIAGINVTSSHTLVLSAMTAAALYLTLKSKYDEEIHMKGEMFLKTYRTLKSTRCTFSEVKKITRRFNNIVGQGGFGCVYKAELSNGEPVAVKMLENSTGQEEF
ncbi:hypothetical protein ACJX0J_015673, partial [Zea mays]